MTKIKKKGPYCFDEKCTDPASRKYKQCCDGPKKPKKLWSAGRPPRTAAPSGSAGEAKAMTCGPGGVGPVPPGGRRTRCWNAGKRTGTTKPAVPAGGTEAVKSVKQKNILCDSKGNCESDACVLNCRRLSGPDRQRCLEACRRGRGGSGPGAAGPGGGGGFGGGGGGSPGSGGGGGSMKSMHPRPQADEVENDDTTGRPYPLMPPPTTDFDWRGSLGPTPVPYHRTKAANQGGGMALPDSRTEEQKRADLAEHAKRQMDQLEREEAEEEARKARRGVRPRFQGSQVDGPVQDPFEAIGVPGYIPDRYLPHPIGKSLRDIQKNDDEVTCMAKGIRATARPGRPRGTYDNDPVMPGY